jgi:zinc/manganese transport system permease protein
MSDALAFLLPPFLVAVCLVGIHTYFGLQVLARRVIFVDLALAQVAALGATVGFMLGHPAQGLAAYGYSLAFAVAAAALLAGTRAWAGRVPQEALIGVVYVVAAAASILLIDRAPQGAEHLKQILTGNILTSGTDELAVIVPLYAAVGAVHWMLRRRLDGAGPFAWEFVFYATFGVVVTSSVAIAGVLLVFSFLIIPAAIGVIYASSPARQLAIGWTTGTLASAVGLGLSFALDLPTGATMVCTFGAALAVAGLLWPLVRAGRAQAIRRGIVALRWVAAEHMFPSLRALYFSRTEQATFADAGAYAERYRVAADALNDEERKSRSDGSLDDFGVARLSSFLKSYSEMRRGEQFVMDEVRARARARVRWIVSGALLALALIAAPLPWRQLWSRRTA